MFVTYMHSLDPIPIYTRVHRINLHCSIHAQAKETIGDQILRQAKFLYFSDLPSSSTMALESLEYQLCVLLLLEPISILLPSNDVFEYFGESCPNLHCSGHFKFAIKP